MMAAVKNSLNTPSILAGSEHAGPTGCLNSCNVMAAVLLVHFGVLQYHKIIVAVRMSNRHCVCGQRTSLLQKVMWGVR